uniref:Nest forming protein 1 n=1 Tax=Hydropsyche sp. T20 TaxID=173708 RepID=Q6L656_9NEOP|nr:Nest forming protein 1 [Hydropsyche sp. T20]
MKLVFFFLACFVGLNVVQGCAKSVVWDDSWVHGVPRGNRYYDLWNTCCQRPRYDGCGIFGNHLWDYVKYSASWSHSVENYDVGYHGFYWDDSWVHGVPHGNYYYPLWNYCCQHPRCNRCGIFGHHLQDYVKYSASWSTSVENYGYDVSYPGFYWDNSWVHGVPHGNHYYPLWNYCCQHPRCNRCGIFGHHLQDYIKYSASWSTSVENYGYDVGYPGFYWDDSWVHGVPHGNHYYPLWNYCCHHPRCNRCGIFGHHLQDYVKYSASWSTSVEDYGGYDYDFYWDDSWVHGVPHGNCYYPLWNYCCSHPRCNRCGIFGQHLWDYVKYSASHSVEVEYGHDYGYHPRRCYH